MGRRYRTRLAGSRRPPAPAGSARVRSRRRSVHQVHGHGVGQQPPPHGEHGRAARALDQAVELGVGRAGRRRGPRPGSGGRRASASNRRWSSVSTSSAAVADRPGLDGRHVPVGGADVPPPPAVPVGVGGRADAPVVALVPVEAVVPALVPGQGPVGDLLPPVAGRAEHRVGHLVPAGLDVVVGVAGRVGGQRGARLDGQRVGADVGRRGVEGQHVGEALRPVGVGLAGPPEDEVDVPRVEAGLGHRRGGVRHRDRAVATAQSGQHVGHRRLHPQGDPGHPGRPVGGQPAGIGVLGVALHGDLGPRPGGWRRGWRPAGRRAAGDGVPPPKNTEVAGGRPSSSGARPISVTQAAA